MITGSLVRTTRLGLSPVIKLTPKKVSVAWTVREDREILQIVLTTCQP